MCPRRYLYNVNEYAQPTNKNLEFGSLMHHLIEQVYCDPEIFVEGLIDSYVFPKSIKPDEAEKMRAMASVLAPAYFRVYVQDFKYKIIEPELLLDTSLKGVRIRGKIDGIFNRKYMLETKTKGQIVEDNIQARLAIDWQSMFYVMGYRLQTGILLEKVIYNVIRVPGNTIKNGNVQQFTMDLREAVSAKPEYYFMRWETAFTKQDIDTFEAELLEHIARLGTDKLFLRNLCACEAPWPCAFINACATGSTKGLERKPLFSELMV
jgi:hypothetical protein